MTDLLLTAAMVVRDEEQHLPACLESIRELVDEIVIVDTGSTDRTVSIAHSFGARVHVHPWNGDFAEPRNAGLDLAKGTWILYIDADERAGQVAPERVRARLKAATEIALRVRLRPFAGATPYWEYRLWRSDPRIRFVGKIHEKVTMAIRDITEEDGSTIGESELLLEHVGYDGDQARKHARNLPLLEAQLAADPVNSYNWHHLAVVLDALGQPDRSAAALEQAVRVARETGTGAGVLAFLRLIQHRREQGQDTEEVLQEALARYPDSIALAWLKVIVEIGARRYEPALRTLERFDADPEMPIEDTVAYPSEMFGARAAEARGLCLFRLGRYREAAEAYADAEGFEPDQPAHRLKRLLAEHRAARSPSETLATRRLGSADGFQWDARELLSGLAIEMGGVSVGITATDALRAQAIHALLGRTASSDRDPIVRLSFGGHRVRPPDRGPDHCAGPLQIWHDDGALALAYGPLVGARVEFARATLGGYAPDLSRVFHHVAPYMLASLLAPHGRFVLHGGAIQREGRAVLVLGGSATGKSTTVLGALQDGWSVLSDDLAVVRSGVAGPLVSGIPKPLVVPGEVLSQEMRFYSSPADPRARVKLPYEAWDRDSHPVSAVVIVGHGDRSAAIVEPIERTELLGKLYDAMLSRQPSNIRRYFSVAVALCDIPAFWLRHSRASELRARQAADAIAAQLAD